MIDIVNAQGEVLGRHASFEDYATAQAARIGVTPPAGGFPPYERLGGPAATRSTPAPAPRRAKTSAELEEENEMAAVGRRVLFERSAKLKAEFGSPGAFEAWHRLKGKTPERETVHEDLSPEQADARASVDFARDPALLAEFGSESAYAAWLRYEAKQATRGSR